MLPTTSGEKGRHCPDYSPVAVARTAAGLRLATTRGIPGPWGEAAKGLLYVKQIPYVRVAQEAGGANDELRDWTGFDNAPVLVWNDEPAVADWAAILHLAERLVPEPPLIPADQADRAAMFGFLHELCGQDGFGWNRRLIHFAQVQSALATQGGVPGDSGFGRMLAKYPVVHSPDRARARLLAILGMQGSRLRAQRALGSPYYFGDALTAADIYAAAFAAMIRPLPREVCPMADDLMASYTLTDPQLLAAVDPAILDHRDFIYEQHLELPLAL